jgi:hypothetical protein
MVQQADDRDEFNAYTNIDILSPKKYFSVSTHCRQLSNLVNSCCRISILKKGENLQGWTVWRRSINEPLSRSTLRVPLPQYSMRESSFDVDMPFVSSGVDCDEHDRCLRVFSRSAA